MTVGHLVQEHGIDRTDVFIAASGETNTAGKELAGSDGNAGEPSPAARSDAPLSGAVIVSVDIADEGKAAKVREAFGEFEAAAVSKA